MENQTKKKINKMIASGAKISDISETLGLPSDEVSKYVRKFFASRKARKKDNPGVIVKFPNHRTIQVKSK